MIEDSDGLAGLRAEMVAGQIERRGLHNPRLLQVLRRVPRHLFLPMDMRMHAYADRPLPIGRGQTISQPYIVALMTSLLGLLGDERVLEIGTGSGYQAAVLSEMAGSVHSVERFESLADAARARLIRLGYYNVQVHCADGSLGWPEAAPYKAIIVTAAAGIAPTPLIDQLADGGRMVLPIGGMQGQILQLWTREGSKVDYQDVIPVSFVPLRGKFGWSTEEWEPSQNEDDAIG